MSENTSVGSLSESGVLITDELYQRPCRPLNLEAEVQIFRALAQQLTRPPQAILKYLVSAAVDLCQASSAGVSLIEILPNGEEVFRWVALAGVYEPYEGGITDREHSPCGVCLSRGCPQLYHHPERYFPRLQQADPPIVEELVVPLLLEGQALGTIWIASHSGQRQFDGEDMRILTSLADFTAAAIHSSRLRQAALEAQQALRQSQAQMQTLVTNMPGMVYRYSPCADGVSRFIFVNSGCRDLFEVEPEAALQDAGSIWSLIHADDRFSFQASLTAAVENFLPWDWQGRIITPSGQLKWIQGNSSAVKTDDGAVWDGLLIDITQRKQAELLLVEQKKLLELAASGHPLDECLSSLCASMSKLNPRVRACILLPNAQRSAFESFITPDFEPSFGQGLKDAPINELAIGTCGTAVYCGQPVTCSDIAKDERWSQEWRDLCVAHGILGCYSTPVLGLDGQPLGSLMLCFGEARMPTDWEYQLAEFGTHIASIVFERDRSNLALRESEELKQRILESSNDCIKVLTLDGRFLFMNTGGTHLFEMDDPTSLLNAQWLSFWEGEDQKNAMAAIAAAKVGDVGRFQGYCPTAKGTPKWWDVVVTPIRDASGQITQLLSISRDITEVKRIETLRQQAEMKLREAHVQLESALVAGAVYTWRWNILTDRVIVNTAFAHLFAIDPVDATTTGLPIEFFINAMYKEDRLLVVAAINQVIETGEEYASEYRVRTASGEERWLNARGRAEYDAAGNPVSFPGALVDITDRKLAEASLRQLSAEIEEQLRKFDAVVSSVPDFIYTFDLSGRFTYVNQPLLDLWQKTLAKSVGKNFFELDYPTELAARLQRQIQEVITTRQPLKDETPYTSAFGTRAYEYIFVPLFDVEGAVSAVAGTTRDITDRKRSEAEREQLLQREQAARETAERANQIKDEFLAVLSHELRSPLNPILGWTSLLRNGRLDVAKTSYALETIERNAKLQVQLIEDLLDISRILRGKLSLNVMPVDLSVVIKAALETVRLATEAKSLQIQMKLSQQVVTINADAGRLQQVLWNLLSNAVKFTPNGGQITVALTIAENHAQIQVSDTGKGINPDFLPYIFEHFRQEDGATTRKFGGLGLGLAIARQIVELHGGTIQVESSGEGQGATFIVKLPLPRNKNYETRDEPIAVLPTLQDLPLSNVQVLVVDDDTDTREFIVFVLELAGAIVTSVPSAIAALEVLAQSKLDVLVSDIGMPEMDGYMLMRQIRAMEQGKPIPAVALTAYAGETDRHQALLAGFQKHVSKPIEPEMLVQTIISLIACG
ncbi:MAG: PAS domain-containing protein [Nostoc sp. ChiQUE02]|uniref:PAS domain-containing protein n=1 Tax=Nostoc sp. ChiQUE02 TaxID=3075377 RepID=UPI002AD40C10|nr:PAS domain-containing protein [Nostoc sp. ChiQUE02]MDZ8233613.1 PAS domain-containing protein [Nostoc sp. ChiQUE02]